MRPPDASELLDVGWRPFDVDKDRKENFISGFDYGKTYADDRTSYYYWRHDGP